MAETADVIIIGGGVTGTSIALHLARRGAGKVLLLERDTIASGGTGRSSGIIRTHYANPYTTRLAVLALTVFRNFAEVIGGDAGFHNTGYLMVAGHRDTEALRRNVEMQQDQGAHTEMLSLAEARELEPRLRVDDLGAACYEPDSGYADPAMTAGAFAAAAQDAGAEIRQGTPVTAIHVAGGRVRGVTAGGREIHAPVVVNAAGYHARAVGALVGVDLPVQPERHFIAIFRRPPGEERDHPIVSDRALNAYFRPELHGLTLVGSSDPQDAVPDPSPDSEQKMDLARTVRFAANLMHRFLGLEEAEVRRGYTGVYDVSPDHQPLLGPVPGIDGLYCAAGFSGHGFKLSPAVGQAMAELILEGQSRMADLSPFRLTRFAEGEPIRALHPYGGAFLS